MSEKIKGKRILSEEYNPYDPFEILVQKEEEEAKRKKIEKLLKRLKEGITEEEIQKIVEEEAEEKKGKERGKKEKKREEEKVKRQPDKLIKKALEEEKKLEKEEKLKKKKTKVETKKPPGIVVKPSNEVIASSVEILIPPPEFEKEISLSAFPEAKRFFKQTVLFTPYYTPIPASPEVQTAVERYAEKIEKQLEAKYIPFNKEAFIRKLLDPHVLIELREDKPISMEERSFTEFPFGYEEQGISYETPRPQRFIQAIQKEALKDLESEKPEAGKIIRALAYPQRDLRFMYTIKENILHIKLVPTKLVHLEPTALINLLIAKMVGTPEFKEKFPNIKGIVISGNRSIIFYPIREFTPLFMTLADTVDHATRNLHPKVKRELAEALAIKHFAPPSSLAMLSASRTFDQLESYFRMLSAVKIDPQVAFDFINATGVMNIIEKYYVHLPEKRTFAPPSREVETHKIPSFLDAPTTPEFPITEPTPIPKAVIPTPEVTETPKIPFFDIEEFEKPQTPRRLSFYDLPRTAMPSFELPPVPLKIVPSGGEMPAIITTSPENLFPTEPPPTKPPTPPAKSQPPTTPPAKPTTPPTKPTTPPTKPPPPPYEPKYFSLTAFLKSLRKLAKPIGITSTLAMLGYAAYSLMRRERKPTVFIEGLEGLTEVTEAHEIPLPREETYIIFDIPETLTLLEDKLRKEAEKLENELMNTIQDFYVKSSIFSAAILMDEPSASPQELMSIDLYATAMGYSEKMKENMIRGLMYAKKNAVPYSTPEELIMYSQLDADEKTENLIRLFRDYKKMQIETLGSKLNKTINQYMMIQRMRAQAQVRKAQYEYMYKKQLELLRLRQSLKQEANFLKQKILEMMEVEKR